MTFGRRLLNALRVGGIFAFAGPPLGALIALTMLGGLGLLLDYRLWPGTLFITALIGGPPALVTGAVMGFLGSAGNVALVGATALGAVAAGVSPFVLQAFGEVWDTPPEADLVALLAVIGAIASLSCMLIVRRLRLLPVAPAGVPQ